MCKKEKKKKQSGNIFSFLHKKETEQEYNEKTYVRNKYKYL